MPQAFGHGTMVAGIIHLVTISAVRATKPLKAFKADGSSNLFEISLGVMCVSSAGNMEPRTFLVASISGSMVRGGEFADTVAASLSTW